MTATVRTTGLTDGTADLAVMLAPAPDRRGRRNPGRHLRPVEKPTKKRSPAVPVIVGSGIVIVALFALAAMHALLIGGQLRLDDLRREQASESEEVRRRRLAVAELEAPDRVLEVARDRLGMVDPGEVGYLLPVGVAGGDEAPIRVDAAEPPPPPPPPPVVEKSPEQQEVDGLTGPPLSESDLTEAGQEDPGADPATPESEEPTDATTGTPAPENPATENPATAAPTTPSEGAPDGGQE